MTEVTPAERATWTTYWIQRFSTTWRSFAVAIRFVPAVSTCGAGLAFASN
jgi:hypothetical protein